MKALRPGKKKKCGACKEWFVPERTFQPVCSPKCALARVKAEKDKEYDKAYDKQTRAMKTAAMTVKDCLKVTEKAVNLYVRMRDAGKPCRSCDKPDDGTHQRHASHFRSVGACSSLRFNTFNIHASCKQCNKDKSGNITEYRIRLVVLLGADRVEWLECQNGIVRYKVEYLQRFATIFRKRARLAKKRYLQ